MKYPCLSCQLKFQCFLLVFTDIFSEGFPNTQTLQRMIKQRLAQAGRSERWGSDNEGARQNVTESGKDRTGEEEAGNMAERDGKTTRRGHGRVRPKMIIGRSRERQSISTPDNVSTSPNGCLLLLLVHAKTLLLWVYKMQGSRPFANGGLIDKQITPSNPH